MTFGTTLRKLRLKAGKSRYRLAQFSEIDKSYLLRLERGERSNPSRNVVIRLGLALLTGSDALTMGDIEELLFAAGYAPLQRRDKVSS